MSRYEEETVERLKDELRIKINKVPPRIVNGGVMATRAWMEARAKAEKLLKKRGVTSSELISTISTLE